MLKIGWCRLLRIVKDRLVQVKDLLVLVTLVDVSNVSFHRVFCAVLGTVLAHLGQARCPTWARLLHGSCPLSPIWQTPFGLKPKSVIRACLDFVFLEEWILFGF